MIVHLSWLIMWCRLSWPRPVFQSRSWFQGRKWADLTGVNGRLCYLFKQHCSSSQCQVAAIFAGFYSPLFCLLARPYKADLFSTSRAGKAGAGDDESQYFTFIWHSWDSDGVIVRDLPLKDEKHLMSSRRKRRRTNRCLFVIYEVAARHFPLPLCYHELSCMCRIQNASEFWPF